jgi:hypothetical protein
MSKEKESGSFWQPKRSGSFLETQAKRFFFEKKNQKTFPIWSPQRLLYQPAKSLDA